MGNQFFAAVLVAVVSTSAFLNSNPLQAEAATGPRSAHAETVQALRRVEAKLKMALATERLLDAQPSEDREEDSFRKFREQVRQQVNSLAEEAMSLAAILQTASQKSNELDRGFK